MTNARESLRELIDELEADASFEEPSKFRDRVAALERLDAYDLEGHVARDDEEGENAIFRRAEELHARLEASNLKFCETIREGIRLGHGARAMPSWAGTFDTSDCVDDVVPGESYDYVDELVRGVLRLASPDEATRALEPGMVAYQPTPARHIFDLIRRAELTERDVLVDLGAGLGHVSLLAAICTEGQNIGIEREEAYVRSARRSAAELKLRKVNFVEQDVRETDLSHGTVFYLYTPFRGTILCEVLNLLWREAKRRAIRVYTFGPCTTTVTEEPWLEPIGSVDPSRVTEFQASR